VRWLRNEDERAQALRDMGAEVVFGNLLDPIRMHRVIAGCETMYFSMSISDAYLAATVNTAGGGRSITLRESVINMSQMTVSSDEALPKLLRARSTSCTGSPSRR